MIRLTSVSGDGELDTSSTEAQLTVLQNDDPINFQRSFLSSAEGDTVVFTLERGGQAEGETDHMTSHCLSQTLTHTHTPTHTHTHKAKQAHTHTRRPKN